MQAAKSIRFSVRPELCAQIDSYCKERGCSRDWLIEQAVSQYLWECMEDRADYDDAVAAWEEYEKSGSASRSAEEVFAKAGV